jgi:hypothetical protein
MARTAKSDQAPMLPFGQRAQELDIAGRQVDAAA